MVCYQIVLKAVNSARNYSPERVTLVILIVLSKSARFCLELVLASVQCRRPFKSLWEMNKT